MQYRKLGRTGVDVGVIGMGTEYIWHESREVVDQVMNEAISNGINYFDIFMPSPDIRTHIGDSIKGKRDRIMLQGHIGCAARDGEDYYRTRDLKISEEYVYDFMKRLQTDYIDVLMLHFVDEADDMDLVFQPGGLLDLALRFKKEGKARFIGMSSHRVPTSIKAVESGAIDVLMFPVNPAFDMLEGDTVIEQLWEEKSYKDLETKENTPYGSRRKLYMACEKQGVAIAVMKPYAAGWLFNRDNPSGMVLTPHQCLNYALSQPGVTTVLPGCKTVDHVRDAIAFLDADDREKDFSKTVGMTKWNFKGTCMYCNHCLPCPSGIDIAAVTRLADSGSIGLNDTMVKKYEALEKKASDCIKCEICMERCPFHVNVAANMERAVGIFGK